MGTTAGPAVRWGLALGLGAVWWWAVLRLVVSDDAGLLEGAVAVGGWGLSLLPVHCVPEAVAREDRSGKRAPAQSPPAPSERPEPVVPSEPAGPDESGGWPYGGSGGAGEALSPDSGGWPFGTTRASRHRRSDGGSDPS
ncbi:hypothetical protein [Streptomyces anandii]|uniref:Integral membrane protein n=1 Tax=Streptomyces anandii TaxID=285454 RepID=A0ABW6H844_9ACTN